MRVFFRDRTFRPNRFFELLPPDWLDTIAPFWPAYRDTARIYTLETGGEVLGGGIVFATPSPDTLAYQKEAQAWFDLGYLYIAFLWVAEAHRGRGLGSIWLQRLRRRYPARQRFWLTVDDYRLRHFYELNGFWLVGKVPSDQVEEWIFADRI